MKITRTSMASGITRTMELDITQEQYQSWAIREKLVQDAFPNLTNSEREFILTGMTDEEWDEAFPPDDED